jgi:hypothetical protein
MPANSRLAMLMLDLRQYDQLTLILAGIALLAVLIGWVMVGTKTPEWERRLYFGFLALAFVLILAGCTYLIITGAYS